MGSPLIQSPWLPKRQMSKGLGQREWSAVRSQGSHTIEHPLFSVGLTEFTDAETPGMGGPTAVTSKSAYKGTPLVQAPVVPGQVCVAVCGGLQ